MVTAYHHKTLSFSKLKSPQTIITKQFSMRSLSSRKVLEKYNNNIDNKYQTNRLSLMKHVNEADKHKTLAVSTNIRKMNQLIDLNQVLMSRNNKQNILGKSKPLSTRVLDAKSKVEMERQIISRKLSRIPFEPHFM